MPDQAASSWMRHPFERRPARRKTLYLLPISRGRRRNYRVVSALSLVALYDILSSQK
ncbi:hypothetical protein C7S14_1498 [Burkholderia cepacia]|nr:hypothetical protein C7S14_1498 [Burkholderia cepacia]